MSSTFSTDLYIIRALYDYTIYITYSKYINETFIRDNSKELYKILLALHEYHKKFPEASVKSFEEFEAFFFSLYPAVSDKDKQALEVIFNRLRQIDFQQELVEEIFQRHAEQTTATELSLLGLEVAEGKKSFEELRTRAQNLDELRYRVNKPEPFVSWDVDELEKSALGETGLEWRLNCLNASLGPLRKGDFGFIFKRPETGGTTFLASEVTNFVGQTDRPILWFNNEESGEKVAIRCYQAYFNITVQQFLKDKKQYETTYLKETSGRIKIYDDAVIHRRDVDRLCADFNPNVIIFDQIDKIVGFDADRNDLQLQKIYNWARELAKTYGPVIAICQAGASAEGKQYLTMDDVADSKTSKQGEADWMLGIGKSFQPGLEHIRFFSICKNKLLGGPNSVEEMRHGKMQVRIWPERARYEDIK